MSAAPVTVPLMLNELTDEQRAHVTQVLHVVDLLVDADGEQLEAALMVLARTWSETLAAMPARPSRRVDVVVPLRRRPG